MHPLSCPAAGLAAGLPRHSHDQGHFRAMMIVRFGDDDGDDGDAAAAAAAGDDDDDDDGSVDFDGGHAGHDGVVVVDDHR